MPDPSSAIPTRAGAHRFVHHPPSGGIPSGPEAAFESLLDELVVVLEALRQCHRALADSPDPGGPRELEAASLLDQREAMQVRLGQEIVRVLASGGTVRIESKQADAGDFAHPPGALTDVSEPAHEGGAPLDAERTAQATADAPAVTVPFVGAGGPLPLDGRSMGEPALRLDMGLPRPVRPVARPTAVPPADARPADPPAAKAVSIGSDPAGHTGLRSADVRVLVSDPSARAKRGRSLRETLDQLGRPTAIETEEEAAAAVTRLVDVCSDLDEWLSHPTEVQRSLVGITSSMARHVQDESGALDRNATRALGTWFSTMTRWSGLYKPGFVRGLSRMNRPERGTWLADWGSWWEALDERANLDNDSRNTGFGLMGALLAGSGLTSATPLPALRTSQPPSPVEESVTPTEGEALRALEAALAVPDSDLDAAIKDVLDAGVAQKDARLIALLADHRERVASLRGLKTLKSAIKFARTPTQRPESAEVVPEPPQGPPASWPFYALTRSVNAVVVGGDPRPTDRVRDSFGFASVAWDPIDPRRVDALAARIRALSVEFVILLRDFVSHSVADAVVSACKDAKIPYVVVDSGYGVGQMRLAIERYLQSRLPQA